MERFLSQPFFVAEQFTGLSGKYVQVADTVRSFKEIIEGQHDDIPERLFLMKGTIDEVVEEYRKSGAGAASAEAEAEATSTRTTRRTRVARNSFKVEVLTPEGQVFADEVEMVSTRTTIGSIGVLANHSPLMAILEPTELRLYRSESEIVRFAQGEGYLQVVDNSALVLVEEAIAPEDLDRGAFEARLKEARDAVERAEEGSEERARAEREIKRYEAFLKVGSS